ncbi:aldolase/citrate lyase family protein [Kinneretia aquatilis]|uniref:aldolase/citrate lyase family protein n=1 Tax=Kinneretia aquatilis TaxID=2070761 RepID=UPI0014953C9C|nr:aldolase/citrate lyase family protein [Paucibacter aquatile]WIV97424.1 aldolase/citrate lyase family protein [Paucibacter aquatile]
MKFLLITNCPDIAAFAVDHGVDRIFVDLESLGKQERQGHLDTVMSRHSIADVHRLRPVVPHGRLLVRINPMHTDSAAEINAVISAGADILMLPMFRGPAEVRAFTDAVAGRARTCLLAETIGAAETLRDCVRVPGVDEVHIGLNDLHLELGLHFMFEPLANGMVDELAALLREEGVPFGMGGVARVSEGLLPAELLLSEHARLGSSAAILSRTFHRQASSVAEIEAQMDFGGEVEKLRKAYSAALIATITERDRTREAVRTAVAEIAAAIRDKRLRQSPHARSPSMATARSETNRA